MNQTKQPFNKKKGAITGLVFCFVALIAVAGIGTFTHNQKKLKDQQAQAEKNLEDTTQTDGSAIAQTETKENGQNGQDESQGEEQGITQNNTQSQEDQEENASGQGETKESSSSQVSNLHFSKADKLLRPVSGKVIMDYSMDKSVYFATLDQYQVNPAMIIAGKEGEVVFAAADGEVTSIESNAKTGTTMAVDLGDGYQAIYGQLADVPISAGESVEKGAVLGYLAEPTRYYGEEGCNLYFQLLKDGKTVDPNQYLEKN